MMKKLLFILLFHAFTFAKAQTNLVPNYSFEQKINCITGVDQFIGYVANWTGQGGAWLSWFTAQCYSSGKAGVPDNEGGHQYAHTGDSYAGIATYVSQYDPYFTNYYNYRNYVQVLLTAPLEAGQEYCVTFYVSLSDTSKYACNDIGAYLSDSALYNDPNGSVKSGFTPQVANNAINNPLTSKLDWIRVSGNFVANGGEQYIVIGNFKDDAHSSIDSVGSTAASNDYDAIGAYYYVDDVSVRKIIQVHAGRDTLVCRGQPVLVGKDSAEQGVNYQWAPPTGLANPNSPQTIATPAITTTYTLTASNDSLKGCGCADSVTADMITVSVDTFSISACCSQSINSGEPVVLTANAANSYLWTSNVAIDCDTCQSITVSPTVTTTYYLTETDSLGCKEEYPVTLTVENTLFVPTAFSPNNDGQNDIMRVKAANISSFNMVIYNRWGNKVFESNNIDEGWDGNYDGHPEGAGTYVYYLKGTYKDGTGYTKKGNITLVR